MSEITGAEFKHRHFYGFELWRRARATGADLLWRVKKNQYNYATDRPKWGCS